MDANECATNNGGCAPSAVCTNTAGSRTCACRPVGFTGDGVTCTNINECASNNGGCFAASVCTDYTPQASNGWATFSCGACPAGYMGDGVTCTNINECATNNGGCSMQPLGTRKLLSLWLQVK